MTKARFSAEFPDAFTANGFPLVEFDRKPIEPDPLRGFILTWSEDLTLIQKLDCDQYRLGGYAIFRNSDLGGLREIASHEFLARAAEVHKLWPRKPATVDISTIREAIATAGAAFPLVTIYRERIKKGVCHIGELVRVSQRSATIHSITPDLEWEGKDTDLFKDITLIQFDGVYERLLAQFAPPKNRML